MQTNDNMSASNLYISIPLKCRTIFILVAVYPIRLIW